MKKTTNYNLNKPEAEDFYNVEDSNENMDIIDGKLKELDEKSAQYNDAIAQINQMLKPDYIKTYLSSKTTLTTNELQIIPMTGAGVHGDTFSIQADGTILVKRACHIDFVAQIYCYDGFTSGDWVTFSVRINGSMNATGQDTVWNTTPYKSIHTGGKAQCNAGDVISLTAYNDKGARGSLMNYYHSTFLHVSVMRYV